MSSVSVDSSGVDSSVFMPISDEICEQILQKGLYRNIEPSPLIMTKCDKCSKLALRASIQWYKYDLCMTCVDRIRDSTITKMQEDVKEHNVPNDPEISDEDREVVPMVIGLKFHCIRALLPDVFWELSPQSVHNKYNVFISDVERRFIDTFGIDFLVKVFKEDMKDYNPYDDK